MIGHPFMQTPRQLHFEAYLHVLRYLKGSPRKGILMASSSSLQLIAMQTPIGPIVLILINLQVAYVLFLDLLLSLGKPRNKVSSPVLQLK